MFLQASGLVLSGFWVFYLREDPVLADDVIFRSLIAPPQFADCDLLFVRHRQSREDRDTPRPLDVPDLYPAAVLQ